jgi:hypothetical protein
LEGGDEVYDTVVSDTVQALPVEPHEPWCDLEQHALALEDSVGGSGCVGRYIRHGRGGGWVTEDAPEHGTGPRFVLDWGPAEGWTSLRPEEAAELSGLLARLVAEHRRPTPVRRLFAWSRRQFD